MRPTWTRLQGVTMAPVRGTKDKRDSRRKIRKLVLNRAPLYLRNVKTIQGRDRKSQLGSGERVLVGVCGARSGFLCAWGRRLGRLLCGFCCGAPPSGFLPLPLFL